MAQATSWTPLSFTGEAPKPLYGHTATYCPTAGGGAMIVFGGYNRGEFFADLWRLDFQEQRWQLLKPAGAAPPARRGHSATFCASTDSILVFGGLVDGRGRNDVWRFMIKEGPDGRWQPATAGGGPAARRGHSAVRERAGAVLIFGGRDGVGGRKLFNDLWKLNAEATSWTPLSPTGEAPEPRAGHTATYCPTAGGGAMIVHGGEGYGGECLADLWRLDLQANCWERLNPVGQGPSPRMQHSSILVPEINCLVVFGGVDEGNKPCNDLLFTLDLADLKATSWTALSPTGEAPKPQYGHTATYCPTDGGGAMIVHGGYKGGGEFLGNLWRLDFQALAPAAPKALPTPAPALAPAAPKALPTASPKPSSGSASLFDEAPLQASSKASPASSSSLFDDEPFQVPRPAKASPAKSAGSLFDEAPSASKGSSLFDDDGFDFPTKAGSRLPARDEDPLFNDEAPARPKPAPSKAQLQHTPALPTPALALAPAAPKALPTAMPTPAPAAASSGYPGEPKVPKTLKAPEEAAKQALKKAMEQKDAAVLKEALSAALDCQVSGKVVMEAVDLLSVLQAPVSPTSGRSPSQEALMSNNHSVPVGLQISRTCDRLFHAFCHPGELDADACLADWCRRAREATAPEVLQQSVFGLLYPDDIKKFLLSPDNKLWHDIMEKTEKFIQAIAAKEPAGSPPWSLQEMTPEAGNERLKHLKPVIMDHTVREPATNTPFGHTGYMKYLTLQIVREMGMRDIAISGMYYKASYTPETQILEELWARGESMEGLILMFGPGREDRKAGIQAIKDFNVPNAFLDLTLKASARFAQEDFVTSVLDAVRELDKIFLEQGLPENPWRKDDDFNRTPGKGEISLNLVDLMEFLKLKNSSRQPGTAIDDACVQAAMDAEAAKQAAKAFQTWKNDPVFCRRVVAILSEEGRGCANYLDYGVIAHWLRQHFRVEDQFRILVHAHAGDNNTQDAASVEAVLHGADGVWAAVIPQAAQGGHNSSLVFLDNMLQLGNQHVLDDFWLHQAAQSARHCYYLNFNTYDIPEDCPIWGRRVNQLLHTAFSKVSGEEWRKRRGNYYDVWRPDLRASFDNEEYKKLCGKLHKEVRQVRNDNCVTANYRISPLVSDVETWRLRMDELQADLLERRERLGDFPHDVRCLGFALMNANIRANLDERDTLKQLVDIVRRKKLQRATFPEVAAYEKAKQHQGDERMA